MGKDYSKKYRSEQVSLKKEPRLLWVCMQDDQNPDNVGHRFFEVVGAGNAGNYPAGTIVTLRIEEGGV